MALRAVRRGILLLGCICWSSPVHAAAPGDQLSLNGAWEVGPDRSYVGQTFVPGVASSPNVIASTTLWYRKRVTLPAGSWSHAWLELHGARFAPRVYLNGREVGRAEGGMAPMEMELPPGLATPGSTVELEIELEGLGTLDPHDASSVPPADRWRSDVSSGLWDDVMLHFSAQAHLEQTVVWTQFLDDRLDVHWTAAGTIHGPGSVRAQLVDPDGGRLVAEAEQFARDGSGVLRVPLRHQCRPWSPDDPKLYRLRVELRGGRMLLDRRDQTWGLRDFRTQGTGLALNGSPVHLRGATVVWHRWVRDPEAPPLAWDTAWFQANVAGRLKSMGANFLRFHLGLPPERFLDLCDRDGLMVQAEWLFFHGIEASPASMARQWRAWLEVAARHPSVVIVHPWNETDGDQLKRAWSALDSILPEFPPLVVAHRDEIPVHKYWWSLFENLGLYYDSADQFGRPVVVDEFGGNYLDGHGEMGAYPAVRESYLRFLGEHSTAARRLEFQAEASAKVAEYWRRLGAAGVAPFCTLSSPPDGNTWFLGPLRNPQPKPVWAALSAAYAPVAASLEIWDRNFLPRQSITIPVHVFNDTAVRRTVDVSVAVCRRNGQPMEGAVTHLAPQLNPHGHGIAPAVLVLPDQCGEWTLRATVADSGAAAPAVSSWNVRTLRPSVPAALRGITIGLLPDDRELAVLARQDSLATSALDDPRVKLLALSAAGWKRLLSSRDLASRLESAVRHGRGVVLLDVGPRELGAGYRPFDPSQLEGAPQVSSPKAESDELFAGITATFTDAAEPESHFHPVAADESVRFQLPPEATWLWNGLKGGLVAPAADMEITGLGADAFAAAWVARGAALLRLKSGGAYFAFRLADYFAFGATREDPVAMEGLRALVRQRVEDAPALRGRLDPAAPIEAIDLAAGYRRSCQGDRAQRLILLARAGKNLLRTPVVELRFGAGQGRVIFSQVLTAGRLTRGQGGTGLYDVRYDPAAEQFALNLLAAAVP